MVGTAQVRLCPPYGVFFPSISFAAINPPPAISRTQPRAHGYRRASSQYPRHRTQQGADDVVRRQAFAGQQRRKQHNQQRPEIIQQASFGRRREAQRQEIQRMISEQATDPDDPRSGPLPQRANRPSGRPIQVRNATSAPIANVIAASWNAGIFPVATVSTASSDHIRIAVSPISVAVREVIQVVIPGRE